MDEQKKERIACQYCYNDIEYRSGERAQDGPGYYHIGTGRKECQGIMAAPTKRTQKTKEEGLDYYVDAAHVGMIAIDSQTLIYRGTVELDKLGIDPENKPKVPDLKYDPDTAVEVTWEYVRGITKAADRFFPVKKGNEKQIDRVRFNLSTDYPISMKFLDKYGKPLMHAFVAPRIGDKQ